MCNRSHIVGIQDAILKEDHPRSRFQTLMSLESSLTIFKQVAVSIFVQSHMVNIARFP
jgi:hypothetical protein